jgi:hypothetical protein
MIIKGGRRGGATQLAAHLLRRDTNEDVIIREISVCPGTTFTDDDLHKALKLMAVPGQAKGKTRTLYHSVLAPQAGEILTADQLKHAVDTLAKNLGMEGHSRAIVEHRKAGRQHFHVVFNILHHNTGKQARLQWTRKVEWNTSRQLEKELGLKLVVAKGKAARRWEAERGKRSSIDPLQVRKEVTAIYKASKTGKEFIASLDMAGYVLTKGRNNSYVLVDKVGDIHGLMRRIEGVKLKDLRQKFPDLKDIRLPVLDSVVKKRKPVAVGKIGRSPFLRRIVREAYRTRKTGKGFISALNRQGHALNRTMTGYAVIDTNGIRLDLGLFLDTEAVKKLNTKYPDLAALTSSTVPVGTVSGVVQPSKTGKSSNRKRQRTTTQQVGAGGSHQPSYATNALMALSYKTAKAAEQGKRQEDFPLPQRPIAHGGMSLAQRVDLQAAIDGKITWAEYFQKWGRGGPSL